jgi:hypothetical protein
MKVIDLKVCTDCLLYLANGDFPVEWEQEDIDAFTKEIDFRWPPRTWSLCAGNSEGDDDEFSWSSCAACGSNLGGARHPAHAIER